MRKFLILVAIASIALLLAIGRGLVGINSSYLEKLKGNFPLDNGKAQIINRDRVKVVSEESLVIDVVKKVTPAVVTVGITKNQPTFDFNDQFGFGPFGFYTPTPRQRGSQQIKQDIGSGFIVKSDGLIITNKHVVSDAQAKYRVITSDNKSYDVQKIYRDPSNDFAILKITASNLPTVELGSSGKLEVGQLAIAIGTALGEFRSTVTTGVVSGLSRGITAGSPFEGAEKLENVIQTSAAINPGNSGGPLLNSSGQVIGVNVAVASDAQNIGFALPIDLLKDSLKTFESNGQFKPKAFLGVQYRMITRDLSILNEIPEGAYVQAVVADSPADKVGIVKGDSITKFDGKNVREADGGLSKFVASKKPGDSVELSVYKDNSETKSVRVTLGESTQ